ncbi:MAG: mechanosensitive ion channel [Verrucomicrobia bacterium]|nr:mechanosensitive ion channel [Verrucomicrobiota bacterium]
MALAQVSEVKESLNGLQRWLEQNGVDLALKLAVAVAILIVGRLLANAVRRVFARLLSVRDLDPTAGAYLGGLAAMLIQIFAVVTALGQIGVPSAHFAALVAATGLAIGLALQGNLSNFAAGLLILIFRPFRRGDLISIGTPPAVTEGLVEEVQAFSTVLRTGDLRTIIVPNSVLTAAPLTNYTRVGQRGLSVKFAVPRETDLAALRAALLDEARSLPQLKTEPPPVLEARELAPTHLLVEFVAFADRADFAAVNAVLLERLKSRLDREGIGAPVPVQRVLGGEVTG